MLELGGSQNMTGVETKPAKGKCIAIRAGLSALLNFLVYITLHERVTGQMGHHFWMRHVGHGSLPVTH